MLLITDNTTLTNYTVTGLNDNTAYHVSVTANNNGGSSNTTNMMTMINSNGKSVRSIDIDKSLLMNYVHICVNLASLVYALCKVSV